MLPQAKPERKRFCMIASATLQILLATKPQLVMTSESNHSTTYTTGTLIRSAVQLFADSDS
jgi:hypothetical protein